MASAAESSYPSGPPAVLARLGPGESFPRMLSLGRFFWPIGLAGLIGVIVVSFTSAPTWVDVPLLTIIWIGVLTPVVYGWTERVAHYYFDSRYFAFYLT